jgi:serine/threonine protein phosphatase PrpC
VSADLNFWAATDVGRERSHDEDKFLIDPNLSLFVVADGMGGHASGEVASAIAVHTIHGIIAEAHNVFSAPRDDDYAWHMEVCILLEHAVHMACANIYEKAQAEPEKRGMGTTVVTLLIAGNRGYIAYVGDSRLYLVRGGLVYQLTEDHSLMNELVRRGKVTAEEFDDSPYAAYKNAMTRAVGPTADVEVDTLDFDMAPGDSFLLCSDGLYEYLDDQDLTKTLTIPEIRDVPGKLIEMANTRGGKDNITAVVIQVPYDGTAPAGGSSDLNTTIDILRRAPLFEDLTYQQLVRMMNVGRLGFTRVGDLLFREGDPGEDMLVVLSGQVVVTRGGAELVTLGAGAHIGEMSLVDDAPRSASASCVQEGRVLRISRDDFEEILRAEPALGVKLLRRIVSEMANRLRNTNAQLSTAVDASIVELDDELIEEFVE